MPPETRRFPGRTPRANDADLVVAIGALPRSGRQQRTRIGVLNEAGRVYREVILHSPMQALHFQARMNALGMRYLHSRRIGKFLMFDGILA